MCGYYYCSVSTFLNIMTNRSIFLSDPLKMNDYEEATWLLKLMEKIDKTFVQKNFPELLPVIEDIIPRLRKILIEEGQNNMYICCFSQTADLLSQWQGYADGGQGVSIGFDLNKMVKRNQKLELRKVNYTNQLDDMEIIEMLDNIGAMEIYSRYTSRKDKKLVDFCLRMMLGYKNPAFIQENEVRLMYSRNVQFVEHSGEVGIYDGFSDEKSLEPKFRMSGTSDLIEYVELNVEPDEFVDIYLGPSCKLGEHYIKRFVRETLKREIDVHISDITYR